MNQEGVSAGLKFGLVFSLGFWGLGYSIATSIIFGILGGWASGFLVAWWNTGEEEIPTEDLTADRNQANLSELAKKHLVQQQKIAKAKKRRQRFRSSFISRLFRSRS